MQAGPRRLFAAGVAAMLLFAFQTDAKLAADARQATLRALADELERNHAKLRLDDFEKPYFISYSLVETESVAVEARFGALFKNERGVSARLYPEVRVGSYDFDNSSSGPAPFFLDAPQESVIDEAAPILHAPEALRRALWLLTDERYKDALVAYQKRRGEAVYQAPDAEAKAASFSRETPGSFIGPTAPLNFDQQRWTGVAVELSEQLGREPGLLVSGVGVSAQRETRWLVNSEGARIIEERRYYTVYAAANARASDGMLLDASFNDYGRAPEDLPSPAALRDKAAALAADLRALCAAPVLEPYHGPAILLPLAAAVLFHEVIGHRLEGERQSDDQEGRTFQGREGQAVIPEFLGVVDDPTLERWTDGAPLYGHYRHDEEGVPAQRVALIEHGVLRRFLMSRTPIKGFDASNGHGRGDGRNPPRARMGVTIVESERRLSAEQLKARLMQAVADAGKPYGLVIADMRGGDTNTSTYGYQAFRGSPTKVFRVYPDGREELVRGVEMVGTPLVSINKILATGDDAGVFNGYCGAESGYIPVSAVAPSVLVGEIELQRRRESKARPPLLPPPALGEKAR